MMSQAIRDFAKQFLFEPKVENAKRLKKTYRRSFVIGMGGSHLAADVLLLAKPDLPLMVWSDYGLPPVPPAERKGTLIIASSYSGNTEETLDGLKRALKLGMPIAVLAVGGKLLAAAEKNRLPYVKLPDTGIQPRSALGFSLRALLAILGDTKTLAETGKLARTLQPDKFETEGTQLAAALKDRVPVIYASRANGAIAYNWKIKCNETGKIPAFYNVVPELNHNEMTGFDAAGASKHLSERFSFIFLTDDKDHPRIQKRMAVLETLYQDRGLPVHRIALTGKTPFEKAFTSLILADWTAVHLAAGYGLESEQVPMVEEFKRLI
jgi:glucose/mannose-6-phosphate isomerase